jgi:hypothetical protein
MAWNRFYNKKYIKLEFEFLWDSWGSKIKELSINATIFIINFVKTLKRLKIISKQLLKQMFIVLRKKIAKIKEE